ncbi:MAG: cystathionine beta-synthase [Chloroflexi bacterium]|nr:cystathionine beta-synthase [Chloroflexota bacterium]
MTSLAAQRVYDSILDTIGNTPLVRLNRVTQGLKCRMCAKVEFFNPGGSVKDRIGLAMIEEAEESGRLKPGGTVVESTSGNTGVGLAIACALKGYKAVFVMPDKMSMDKVRLLRSFGAKVVITPTAVPPEDPRSYYSVANRIVAETPNAILANQYHNPVNPESHVRTTGPEIWEQTQGQVTDVIIGMGTGGTVTGVGRYLKSKNPAIKIVGVDPIGSLLYDTWRLGHIPAEPVIKTYKVEGIGEDFVPTSLDLSVVDEVIQVGDKESFLTTRRLVREEGIFCGGSSGTAVAAALRYARNFGPERFVVVILPDSGSRYLTKLFDDEWMREMGFLESAWAERRASDVLAAKASSALHIARPTDRMSDVVALMKKFDVSQLPVAANDGSLTGIVSEIDLLNHLLTADHKHDPDETIGTILREEVATVSPDTALEVLMSVFVTGQVAIVVENKKPVGILTKIDLLDYLSTQNR